MFHHPHHFGWADHVRRTHSHVSCEEILAALSQTKPNRVPLSERFWQQVEKTETCWLWKGWTRSGYGYIGIGGDRGARIGVHRLSFIMHHGAHDESLLMLHSCDVRRCVNPEHIRPGTVRDNTQDMISRNRSNAPCGSNNVNAKLNEGDVREIIVLLSAPKVSMLAIAKRFGVTWHVIKGIRSGTAWKHVPREADNAA